MLLLHRLTARHSHATEQVCLLLRWLLLIHEAEARVLLLLLLLLLIWSRPAEKVKEVVSLRLSRSRLRLGLRSWLLSCLEGA